MPRAVARYRWAVMDDVRTCTDTTSDQVEIEDMVQAFFAAFNSGPDSAARLDKLRSMFLPGAVIIRTCGLEPMVHGLEEFIAPRDALLSGGTLVGFSEWPLAGRIDLFGDIAHWFGTCAKEGVREGAPFTGRGTQFVRTSKGWRISAMAWDDERDGLAIRYG
jgi:hypothetical protein